MKEEKYLSRTFGNANHFSVPDNYFDGFARQLMDSLPESAAAPVHVRRKRSATIVRYMRNVAAAACICGAVIGGSLFMMRGSSNQVQAADMSAQYYSQDYAIDQMADYAMIGNEDLYSYLAEE